MKGNQKTLGIKAGNLKTKLLHQVWRKMCSPNTLCYLANVELKAWETKREPKDFGFIDTLSQVHNGICLSVLKFIERHNVIDIDYILKLEGDEETMLMFKDIEKIDRLLFSGSSLSEALRIAEDKLKDGGDVAIQLDRRFPELNYEVYTI